MDIDKIKKDIIEKLDSKNFIEFINKFKINSVILFGSICTDEFNELSDVDIAILGEEKLSLDNVLDMELFLEEFLNTEVDVIDLKSYNLDLFVKINILNTGRVIYTTDNNRFFNEFCDEVHRIYIENEDYMYFRRRDVLSIY